MSEQPSNIYSIDEARKAQIRHELEHVDATPLENGVEAHFHESSEPYDAEAVINGRLAQFEDFRHKSVERPLSSLEQHFTVKKMKILIEERMREAA